MIKSIKLKLWLTLFVTLVISLGALLTLTYLSVKQRFLEYATEQILERLVPLEQAVIEVYSSSENSLEPFIQSPSRWNTLRDTSYRQYLKDQNRRSLTGPQKKDWSERESRDKKIELDQRAFFQHLILTDQERKPISGRTKEGAKYVLRELRHQNEVIAFIGYVKPKAFIRSVDKLFVDQQIRSFGILSIAMVFAALFVTLFVSRWLVVPLSLLSRCAKHVSAGDFSVRIGFKADDELGKLCQNFDDMTTTLEKNEMTRKQWVADISHEMRTPLSVLKAQLEAMEDGIRAPTTENLNLLKRNVDSLSFIINDLYELSLTDLGELNLHKDIFSLNDTLKDVIGEFDAKFKQKSFLIDHNLITTRAVKVYADKNRIKQVLSNLLENSCRYTDDGGNISIGLYEQEGQAVIEVEDSAPGLDQRSMERIFDRLYRVESSRNRETGGAGLGLSICQGITKAHGGSIVASNSLLGGIKQTIKLPLNNDLKTTNGHD